MDFTKRLCHFLIILGLCAMVFIGYKLIQPFISTMDYILQFVFLVSALILICCKDTSNKNTENHSTREAPSAVQNTTVTQRQNNREKENLTAKPKHTSLAIPTAKVNGTKRLTRFQRDFLSTAPGKLRNRGNIGSKTAVSEAVRENIKLIENDLKVKESSLLDEMQGYLTEGEVDKITNSSRKDQAHYFAAIIEEYDDSTFLSVLDILNKSSFGHISSELKKSFDKHLPTQLPSSFCVICRIQSEVDIKSLRCELIKEELLSKNLKDMINDCKTSKGHQNILWQELFFHLKSMQPKQKIAEKFISIFKNASHGSISSYLSNHGLTCYDCTCHRKSSIETDNFRAMSSLTSSDESNTSPIPIPLERHLHSSSNEEGAETTTIRSKNKPKPVVPLNRSKFPSRTKNGLKVKTKPGRGPASTAFQQSTENSEASTTSLDSCSGLHPVYMSEIPSTRNGIHHQQPSRPVKRAMNSENRQREETAELLSISGSEDCTSDTLLKTPFETEECLRKRRCQRVDALSALPFISESDVNSDGEVVKNCFSPVIKIFVDNSGDIVPKAFAKTHKYKNESQIF